MIKKIILKKILIPTIVLIVLSVIYFFPTNKNSLDLNKKQKLKYVYNNYNQSIYLIDSKNYISKTTIAIDTSKEVIIKAREMIEALTIDGPKQDIIPNGFRAIIPSDTKIIDILLENKTIKINFSKEILTINKDLEEKMIEAIIYSLTSIDGIENIIISVESNILSKLPNSKKVIPNILDRKYGINKKYDISSNKDINSITVYYVNSFNNKNYYTPVTKYVNSNNDKIKIIINELAASPLYESNLMSFLNSSTKLVEYGITDNTMNLHFNNYIFEEVDNTTVLEEVIYTILLSIKDNYNVEEVSFLVEGKEIFKKSLIDID